MTKRKGEYCEVCKTFVEDFEYQMCCSGQECGCMGLPIEPCLCSQRCADRLCSGHIQLRKSYKNGKLIDNHEPF